MRKSFPTPRSLTRSQVTIYTFAKNDSLDDKTNIYRIIYLTDTFIRKKNRSNATFAVKGFVNRELCKSTEFCIKKLRRTNARLAINRLIKDPT